MLQATTGLRTGGTAAEDAGVGSQAWSNVNFALLEDASWATVSFTSTQFSRGLRISNFGFSVPADAKITGIRVRVKRSASVASAVNDFVGLRLLVGGVLADTSTSKSIGNYQLTTDELVDYGSASDTWGIMLTPAIVNASNFGVQLQARGLGGAVTASVNTIWIEVYYARPGAPRTVSVVLRAGRPPHRALIKLDVSNPKYGFVYRNVGTASAMLRANHPEQAEIARIIEEYEGGVMATFETPDGHAEWAGFLTSLDDNAGDPFVPLTFADHFVDMDDATAPGSGGGVKSSGRIITDALTYAQGVAAPPLFLSLDAIANNSPGVSWEFKGESVLDVIRAMEQQSGYDAWLASEITPGDVRTGLVWQGSQGTDRREEDAWEDGKHFQGRRYKAQYRKGLSRAVTVVGSGATRQIVAVKRAGKPAAGRGGSLTTYALQAATAEAAARIGRSRLDAPENASESLRLILNEDAVDRAALDVGDLRRIKYRVLGQRRESDFKVTGIGYAPGTGAIEITGAILSEGT
jgi:hypothetical protein